MQRPPSHMTIALAMVMTHLIWATHSHAQEPTEAASLNLVIENLGSAHDDAIRASLLKGVLSGLEGRRNIPEPENWPTVSKQLARSVDPLVRERSLQLSQIFGDELATQQALDLVQDDTAEIGRRKAALHLLLNQQNEAASALLPSLIT